MDLVQEIHFAWKQQCRFMAMKWLPPGFRAVFNMYAVEGYSHKDISEQLGISETTSRTQFSRARTWLRKRLEEKNNGR